MANEEDDPFPMLQLPLTMKDMVLSKQSVLDLYNLSQVSKEAKNWVKDYVQNKNYRLKITPDHNSNYVVGLFNQEAHGFRICLTRFINLDSVMNVDRGHDTEFNFGQIIAPANIRLLRNGQKIVDVYTKGEGYELDNDMVLKLFMTHVSDVFSRNVCIETEYHQEQNQMKVVMGLVKDLTLNVCCYHNFEKCDFAEIKKLTKYRRVCVEGKNVGSRQGKLLFEEWMSGGTMTYFEIRNLSENFSINHVMDGYQAESIDEANRLWKYSVTRADGVTATVKFFKGKHLKRYHMSEWMNNTGRFIIRSQSDQHCPNCFKTVL